MIPVGWDRSDPSEWAHFPGLVARWRMIRRIRKELRAW